MWRSPHLIVSVAFSVIGCTIWSDWPHENFKEIYGSHVGKKIDDPSTWLARYPQDIVEKAKLPNGNIEIEYLHVKNAYGKYGPCLVFFEVNPETQKIVDWSYEGTEKSCVISP